MRSSAGGVSFGRQVLRRHVNVRSGDVTPTGAQPIELLCECGRSDCADRVRISADAFSAARSAGFYVVAAVHVGSSQRPHAVGDGYALVDGRATR